MVTKKNKSSRKIIDKLRLKNGNIFSKEDIFKIIGEYEKIYKKRVNIVSLWTYLRKDNYIKRILGDYYYVYSLEERHDKYCKLSEEELVFLVLEKMKVKWYLGLESALKKNKISWQVLNVITVINDHFSGIKKLGNSKFKFIKTKDKMFSFGLIEEKTNTQVKISYSNLEKTYLDFLYFHSYQGKDILDVKRGLDFDIKKNKLLEYAKNYSKKVREAIRREMK